MESRRCGYLQRVRRSEFWSVNILPSRLAWRVDAWLMLEGASSISTSSCDSSSLLRPTNKKNPKVQDDLAISNLMDSNEEFIKDVFNYTRNVLHLDSNFFLFVALIDKSSGLPIIVLFTVPASLSSNSSIKSTNSFSTFRIENLRKKNINCSTTAENSQV